MAFNDLEISIFGGKPVELYEFSVLGQYWRYTTDDRLVTFNGADFEPISEVRRGSIRTTQNIERSEMQIRLPGKVSIADQFRVAPPSEPIRLRIYSKHRGDPDYIVRGTYRVLGCNWEGSFATLICQQVHSSLKAPGLRRSYQYMCPYALYEGACGVNRNEYEVIANAAAITTLTLTLDTATSFPDNYFRGGYILWESPSGRQDTRMVMSSLGAVLTLQLTTIGLSVGQPVRAYPGCDHTIQMCYDRFANAERYGGFPFIPETNPFAGTTMF